MRAFSAEAMASSSHSATKTRLEAGRLIVAWWATLGEPAIVTLAWRKSKSAL